MHGEESESEEILLRAFAFKKNQKLGVMHLGLGPSFSYNQDFSLFFIVYEMVGWGWCWLGLYRRMVGTQFVVWSSDHSLTKSIGKG